MLNKTEQNSDFALFPIQVSPEGEVKIRSFVQEISSQDKSDKLTTLFLLSITYLLKTIEPF
jgi:hypothetical protein